ncbi:MAG: HyaD/HybD family hydrogenase maturation endopeptidase [Nitrospirae bacterium CG18_big_fil_WC_8_21_14_2_50_70_55]|nr:HyaD/HybD family hydrogenase maturation endopeptidase [Deltaproteobacteria bacterium]OIP62572.1 MAG: hydrogenase expression/formation protein [Nitrospirae bacterium CG2_30_70_394]PIQ04176.1 MAG: HyaD/HybD family hydrogenase maturation endopeptidase [Nitrospirae bacterium CG18_big_fil_WC_8_21_14_2_50_70_55]PIU79784.1 MAG: HyaD/HybD family hydrogenase maturation endopeptidase [Nitrospirae bacterium CG06_land_8_20_14_3_00_70_43]PIW82634.1 MAG: HyaD/HybD family hydrogenase maturation endopeptida
MHTLVLGIGNPLWADEGFGVRAVALLHEGYRFPAEVEVVDGGTQGLFLLPWVRGADNLLVLDAIDFGDPPATVRVVRGDGVPRYLGAKKVSMHQTGFQEVLASASLAGDLPSRLSLIGVQPVTLDDFGSSLTAPVAARLAEVVELAVAELAAWGVVAEARNAPPEPLAPVEMARLAYERRADG